MPSRHEVSSLQSLSETCFAEHFVRCWVEHRIHKRGDGRVLGLLGLIPPTVANTVIVKIIKVIVQQQGQCYNKICDLLSTFYIANLSTLDLTELVLIGPRCDHHLKKFEKTLMSWFPKLTRITKLHLRTHTVQTTLPICSDNLLEGIGSNIKGLRVLDISKNNLVTDYGLEYLIPCNGGGCPLLEELFVFECSVTVEGIARVVENLCNLRIIGYEETGEVLKCLHDKFMKENQKKLQETLKLTHVNNLGSSFHVRSLACNSKLVDVTNSLCPNLINLKVRITDENMPLLQKFDKLNILEVCFCENSPPIEMGTRDYFKISGHKLYSLSLTCSNFCARYFLILGEFCPNLRKLWFTCYSMMWDFVFDKIKTDVFKYLDTLYFQLSFTETDPCELSLPLFKYLLQNTCQLYDLRLICKSSTLTDSWLKNLWKCFKSDKLVKVLIALPFLNTKKKSLPLTMLSVNLILEQSPCLQYLGNLLVWDVTYNEMINLKTYLNMCNFNVNLVYHPMKIKS